jgi:hypothetical protein
MSTIRLHPTLIRGRTVWPFVLVALAVLAACGGPPAAAPGGPIPLPQGTVMPRALTPEEYTACREAVERVYHSHRTGAAPFEQAYGGGIMATRVAVELAKERALAEQFKITPSVAELNTELRRIHDTTQAPEILGELEAVLGSDPERVLSCLVRPILVDQMLQSLFPMDAVVHAQRRAEAEALRARLLAGEDFPTVGSTAGATYYTQSFALSAEGGSEPGPQTPEAEKLLVLPEELRAVLDTRLTEPGAISDVQEGPVAFLILGLKERTADEVTLHIISLPKISIDEWLVSRR